MKISHNYLRRIIKEEVTRLLEVEYDERRHDARELVEEYREWLRQEDLMYPEDSARAMASYIIDVGYFDSLTDDPRGGTSAGRGRNPALESAFESYYGIDTEDLHAEVMELLEDTMSEDELLAIGAGYDEAGNPHPNDDNRDGVVNWNELDDYGSHINFTVARRGHILDIVAGAVFDTGDSESLTRDGLLKLVDGLIKQGKFKAEEYSMAAFDFDEVLARVQDIEKESSVYTGI